ncbi:MAG: hypothetical protein Q9M15_01920 [Mariprofundaceae bacterium]|nr:hypothetical protein [Mariprofundaceae bacterium]
MPELTASVYDKHVRNFQKALEQCGKIPMQGVIISDEKEVT